MFLGTLVSRILGLVRSPIILGAVVGLTSPAGNAFQVANKLPNLIYIIVVGGLVNAVLVPAIVRAVEKGQRQGEAFINKLLTLSIVGLGIITLVITLCAPFIVKFMAATMSDEWYRLTVAWAYWCLPQIFFYGMYTVVGQILNAKENFGPYMWAPVANNVVAILGMIAILHIFGSVTPEDATSAAMWTNARVVSLGAVSTLGIIVQAGVLIWPLKRVGVNFRFDFAWRGSGLGSAGKASWWMFLIMVCSIIPTALDSNVAAGASTRALHAGIDTQQVAGNFAYDTAYTIYAIPTSLFVVSIATAVFTRLSRAAAKNDIDKVRQDVDRTLKLVGVIMILASTCFVVLAVPIARIFALSSSSQEAFTLAKILAAMSVGLVGTGLISVLNRVYYAFEDTRGAFYVTLVTQIFATLWAFGCFLLPPQWAVFGVCVGMSVTNLLGVPFFMMNLTKHVRTWPWKDLALFFGKLLLAALISGGAAAGVSLLIAPIFAPISFVHALLTSVVGGTIILIVYFLVLHVLRVHEIYTILRPLTTLTKKILRK